MFKLARTKIGGSQKQVDIVDINDGVLQLPNNNYRQVIEVASVNFELKSEAEQDVIIDSFEGFLNSINFPIQIIIRIREIDMDEYLNNSKSMSELETEYIYKKQLSYYQKFIKDLVTDNKILTRQFYVVIPFEPLRPMDHKLIKEQLNLRIDIVIRNLSRLGISCRELSSIELVDLFYSFYNPEKAKIQPISNQVLNVVNQSFVRKRNTDGQTIV